MFQTVDESFNDTYDIIHSYTENHFSLFKVMLYTPLKVVKIHGASDLFGMSYGTKSYCCLV